MIPKKDYTVTLATSKDCLEILDEPRLLAVLPVDTRADLIRFVTNHRPAFHTLRYKQYHLVFWYRHIMADIYEVHVACPTDSIIACRVLLACMVEWVFKVGAPECIGLTTKCPEGKIANTLRKLGCIEFNKLGGSVYFSLPRYSV